MEVSYIGFLIFSRKNLCLNINIDTLRCESISSKDLAESHRYSSYNIDLGDIYVISITPKECWKIDEEGNEYHDNICLLKYVRKFDFRNIEILASPETIIIYKTSIPFLAPWGPKTVSDAPECIFEIWINSNRYDEAIKILSIFTPVIHGFIDDITYIFEIPSIFLLKDFHENFNDKIINNIRWKYKDLSNNYKKCIEWWKHVCGREYDEECIKNIKDLKTYADDDN